MTRPVYLIGENHLRQYKTIAAMIHIFHDHPRVAFVGEFSMCTLYKDVLGAHCVHCVEESESTSDLSILTYAIQFACHQRATEFNVLSSLLVEKGICKEKFLETEMQQAIPVYMRHFRKRARSTLPRNDENERFITEVSRQMLRCTNPYEAIMLVQNLRDRGMCMKLLELDRTLPRDVAILMVVGQAHVNNVLHNGIHPLTFDVTYAFSGL